MTTKISGNDLKMEADSLISQYETLLNQSQGSKKALRFQLQKLLLDSGIPTTKRDVCFSCFLIHC